MWSVGLEENGRCGFGLGCEHADRGGGIRGKEDTAFLLAGVRGEGMVSRGRGFLRSDWLVDEPMDCGGACPGAPLALDSPGQ